MSFSCHWCGQTVRYVSRCPCGAEPSEEPGCPVRNATAACEKDPFLPGSVVLRADGSVEFFGGSVVEETARERRVHGGGPRILQHDPDTGETKGVR